jgi:hypothetical protein
MLARLLSSFFVALVSCGLVFYLIYFAGMIYAAATGPLNPANSPGLQWALRHFAAPISITTGVIVFWIAFSHWGKRN